MHSVEDGSHPPKRHLDERLINPLVAMEGLAPSALPWVVQSSGCKIENDPWLKKTITPSSPEKAFQASHPAVTQIGEGGLTKAIQQKRSVIATDLAAHL